MKKLIALFAVVAIAFSVTAQEKPAATTTPATKSTVRTMKDMMILRGGKMMIFKDSHLSAMDKPMTMKNGTVITPTGLMTMKDGTTKQLVDGERLDMDGNVMASRPAPSPRQPAQSAPQNNQQK